MKLVISVRVRDRAKKDNHDIAAPSAMIVHTSGGMPRIVHGLPEIEWPTFVPNSRTTEVTPNLHCTNKTEDAGTTIPTAQYRKARKRVIPQKQRAL
jgi:hypothetical protein